MQLHSIFSQLKTLFFFALWLDDKAISLCGVSLSYKDDQNSSTDDSATSLSCQSNTVHVTPASVDSEVLLQKETDDERFNEHSCLNERSCFNTEDDPALVLECTSSEDFINAMTIFQKDNSKSGEQKLSSKKTERPADRNRTASIGHHCMFCGKLQSVIRFHLITAHRDQPQISRIVQLPLQSRERREDLERLIAEGDQKHSEQMFQTGRGTVISSQGSGNSGGKLQKKNLSFKHSLAAVSQKLSRTSDRNGKWKKSTYGKLQKSNFKCAQSVSKYLHCERCGSFVLRSTAWLRHRRCAPARQKIKIGAPSSDVSSGFHNAPGGRHSRIVSLYTILNKEGMDSSIDDVLSLVLDEDSDSLQSMLINDVLVWQYASLRIQSLHSQDSESSHSIYSLCQELQALARLLVGCQRQKPSADLYTLIHPDHFNLVIFVLRKQSTTTVDILGHVINIKIANALQHSDNVAARHAWNFRELFLLWQDSLREDDAVLQTDVKVEEEKHSSADNYCQTMPQTFQQPDNMEYNSDSQSKLCYSHDNTCLTESNACCDKFKDNPVQHMLPDSSFTTLSLDVDSTVAQKRSTLPDNCSHMVDTTPEVPAVDGTEASDINDSDHLLDNVASDHQVAGTSVSAVRVDSELRHSGISSFKTVTICSSSGKPYCCFCGKRLSNLVRHWKSMHANEKEVIKLVSLETATAQLQSVKKLRNLGNHRHNQKVLRDRRGTLVVYRPKPGAKPEDYSPCRDCLHYVTETQLLQHRCHLLIQKSQRHSKSTIGNNHTSTSAMSSDGIYGQKFSKLLDVDKRSDIYIQSMSNPVMNGVHRSAPCYFCGHWNTKMNRHLKARHRDEPEVIEIMSIGLSDSAAEIQHIHRLRNLGMHQHNVKVLKEGHGNFFVARVAESSIKSPEDYLPCEYCWCYVSKARYCGHYCKLRAESEQADRKHDRQLFADAHFLLPTSKKFYDQVNETLDGMKNGNVKLTAQSDPLIGEYVAKLLSIGVAVNAIMNKVHLLAQFLIEIRQMTGLNNATLSSCILPQKFQHCILAVDSFGHSDSETSSYLNSSSALEIKNILRQVSKLLKRDAMDRRERDAVKDMDQFTQLCVSEWKSQAKSRQEIILGVEPESE